MLAAGVLPLATAYSISEAFGFEKGVSNTFREAPMFLGIFTFLVALGGLIAMMPNLPLIRVLLVFQVSNGVLLPVVLMAVLRLVNDREVMVQPRRVGHCPNRFCCFAIVNRRHDFFVSLRGIGSRQLLRLMIKG